MSITVPSSSEAPVRKRRAVSAKKAESLFERLQASELTERQLEDIKWISEQLKGDPSKITLVMAVLKTSKAEKKQHRLRPSIGYMKDVPDAILRIALTELEGPRNLSYFTNMDKTDMR
eukprot:3851475-Lingulodinium_polyedra.AAC.1